MKSGPAPFIVFHARSRPAPLFTDREIHLASSQGTVPSLLQPGPEPVGSSPFPARERSARLTVRALQYNLYPLRIIKEQFLKAAASPGSKAGKWLEAWRLTVKSAEWDSIRDVRKTYPSADTVKVKSGRSVTVFNVCGNDFRLLIAIHYDKKRIYTLQFLTHAEYDKNKWKTEL